MASAVHDSKTVLDTGTAPIVIHMPHFVELSDELLMEMSALNRDLRIECNAQGELIFMQPAGGDNGDRNAEITMQLRIWAKKNGKGKSYDSSTGFRLRNKAVRSPDASWVANSRLKELTTEERRKYLPLCPDFVLELRSPSDDLGELDAKMQEYMACGAQLGLLLDPDRRHLFVYRPGHAAVQIDNAKEFVCDPVLPGFKLELSGIW